MQEKSIQTYFDLKTDIIKLAEDFTEAYKRCIEGKNARIDEYGRHAMSDVNIPAIVNASFACELYLKALLNVALKEHRLKVLYEKLPQSLQERIKSQMDEKFSAILMEDLMIKALNEGKASGMKHIYYFAEDKEVDVLKHLGFYLFDTYVCYTKEI